MKQLSLSRMVAVACILCASSAGASAAQNKHGSDPARWYKGDSTQAQRMQVLKKELNAAYAEQTAACKKKKSGKQSACLKEARANFQRDSANARQLVANAPQSEITERVVSTTPAGGQDTMQSGATAVGGSGAAGQTGSGAGQTGMGSNPAMNGGQQSGAPQSGAQSGAQSGYGTSGAQSGYGSSAAGTMGAGTNQSGAPINGPTQSGSNNSNGSQSGTNATQSMGAGTGATQSDTQDQPRAGAVPPVQR